MGGLAFLVIVGLYIAATIFVVHRIPVRWGKALAIAVAILLPTADALWGRYVTLPKLCQDAGLKVFKKASKEGGLMTLSSMPDEYLMRESGIFFVEGVPRDGRCTRVSIVEGNRLLEQGVAPRSRYRVSDGRLPTRFGNKFDGYEIRLEDRQTSEVLAHFRAYGFRGGWAERFLGGLADSGAQGVGCSSPAPLTSVLIQNAFN